MKKKRWHYGLVALTLLWMFTLGCKSKNTTPSIVADADGNIYNTVTIGTQVWMTENLKTTKYNDGTSIALVSDEKSWSNITAPAFCWYNNDSSYKDICGALYNWYAVNTAKLAPKGWHVPTESEWSTLEKYLIENGYNFDGTKTGNKIAKSMAATLGWNSFTSLGAIGNDLSKNNSSGFTALPCGVRDFDGMFDSIGNFGNWWTSPKKFTNSAWSMALAYDNSTLYKFSSPKSHGFSVRCIRDY